MRWVEPHHRPRILGWHRLLYRKLLKKISRMTTELVKSHLETEQVSSGSLKVLPGVGEIVQLQCRLYCEAPSLFRPVPQLEDANMSI